MAIQMMSMNTGEFNMIMKDYVSTKERLTFRLTFKQILMRSVCFVALALAVILGGSYV